MNKTIVAILKKVLLHLLYWIFVWVFFSNFFSVGSKNSDFIFWFSAILSSITIVSSYVFVYHLIPCFLINKKHIQFAFYTFYAAIFIVCTVLMTMVFGFVFFYNLEFQKLPGLTKNYGVILVCVFLIIVFTSAFKILKHNYRSLEEKNNLENKFLQAQLQLKEQELKFLKMQIHPHFLFNTLNTLYGFSLKKSDQTPEMILKLSSLIDYILYQVDKPLVLLKSEIQHIKDYISLEKLRFQESLQINFLIDIIDDEIKMAPMLLLPFVENAFKHGSQNSGVLFVNIQLKIDREKLFFSVENSSINKDKSDKGIGLSNLKKRLEMLYKDSYSLAIDQQEKTFKIQLEILLDHES